MTELIARIARLNGAPRPVVILGEAVIAPAAGFKTGEQKQAFLTGRFRIAEPLTIHGRATGGVKELGAALQVLRTPQVKCCFPTPASPMLVDGATLTTAEFITDRGRKTLPAWAFHIAGLVAPAFVLAAPATTTVVVPPAEGGDVHATITADDRHLTLHFVGARAGTGPCEANYTGTAIETHATVIVHVVEHAGKAQPGIACDAVGYDRQIALVLDRVLGPRLVLAGGGVVQVDPSA